MPNFCRLFFQIVRKTKPPCTSYLKPITNYKRPVPWDDILILAFDTCKNELMNLAILDYYAPHQ